MAYQRAFRAVHGLTPDPLSAARRRLSSGEIISTALELLGVTLTTNGLRLIYVPAAWVFVGLVCFAASYVLATTARRPKARALDADVPTLDENATDDAFDGEHNR